MKERDSWLDLTHDDALRDHFGPEEEEVQEDDNYYEDCKEER